VKLQERPGHVRDQQRHRLAGQQPAAGRDGVLWLTGEHYCRQQPLSYHARHLPPGVTWYADPSGAAEQCELRRAGFRIHAGSNAIRPGIAAVRRPGAPPPPGRPNQETRGSAG
jgi:hypothetical protein